MATELVTLTWCDECAAVDGSKVAGQPWAVTINGEAFTADLCERHGKPVSELRDQLAEYGRQTGGAKRQRTVVGEQPCPAPGCGYVTTSATGMTAHTKTVHGLTVAELEGTATIPCTAPGCSRKFTARQGLFTHARASHPGWTVPAA